MQPVGSNPSFAAAAYASGAVARAGASSPTAARGADGAEIRQGARDAAWGNAIDSLQGLLGRLQLAPGNAGALRGAIRDTLAPIDQLAAGGRVRDPSIKFTAHDVDGSVESISIVDAEMAPGGKRDLEVTVTQSAVRGELLLDFRGDRLDTQLQKDDAEARFGFVLAGSGGAADFAFASGTTIEDVAAAINARSDDLGVVADAFKGGVLRLRSAKHGDDEFVSVDVVEDGGFAGHLYKPGDSSVEFGEARRPMVDFGQSLRAVVDGIEFVGDGLFLRTAGAAIDAVILLHESRAQTLGKFVAAEIRAWAPPKAKTPNDLSPGTRSPKLEVPGPRPASGSGAAALGAVLDLAA